MKKSILILMILSLSIELKSQPFDHMQVSGNDTLENTGQQTSEGINFYIITKEKSKKIDFTSFSTILRAKIRGLFDRKTLYVIIAKSSKDAAQKIASILHRRNKIIENIWFDSHGHYGNHYSSFRVGNDVFSYKNIHDTATTKYLQMIASYCDHNTKIGLGACYAGADFYFPATDSTAASRMNGDTLMIGLGKIFNNATVYASESWVMAKPGIFTNKFGLAGYPLQKRFLDSVYSPVWERLGKWRTYSTASGKIREVNTIALNRWGKISELSRNYQDLNKAKKAIEEKMKKLRPGLARFS